LECGNLCRFEETTEIQASGFAPPNTSESAIILIRPAANTTAIVRGKNNTTGNALVGAYIQAISRRKRLRGTLCYRCSGGL